MNIEEAVALVKQMEYYEAHPHLDGYDEMLDQFLLAMQSDPITLSRAMKRVMEEEAGTQDTVRMDKSIKRHPAGQSSRME